MIEKGLEQIRKILKEIEIYEKIKIKTREIKKQKAEEQKTSENPTRY